MLVPSVMNVFRELQKSGSRFASPTSPSIVVFGSAFETTRPGLYHFTVFQENAGRRAAGDDDSFYGGARAHLAASLADSVCHQPAQRADAAAHEAPLAHAATHLGGRVLVQERVCGARRRRPGDRVVDREPAEARLDLVRLEVLVKVGRTRRHHEVVGVEQQLPVLQRGATQPSHAAPVGERSSCGRSGGVSPNSGPNQRAIRVSPSSNLG